MRILVLAPHPFFTNRGTPIAVRALLEALSNRGCHLHVLTYHEGDDVEIPNCTVERIPRLPLTDGIRPGFSVKKLACDAAMFLRCLSLVRGGGFDLVHAVEEASFIALALKVFYGVPYVYDMDSSLAQQMMEKYSALKPLGRILETCEGYAVRGSSGVLAVCKSLEETARGHAPDALIARLEDVTMLAPEDQEVERLDELIGSSGPLVMYVGNLEKYQGIDLLVEGFAHAVAEVPEARLVVIGGADKDVGHYRNRCSELGVGSQAHFLGPRPVSLLGGYLRQAQVLVSPRTRGTNTAMKIYSYMDSGRPVLATRLLTHTQVLDDDSALLVDPEPEAMGRGLARLLRDDLLRRRLAARASELVVREYSPAAFDRKLTAFYDKLETGLLFEGARTA